MGSKSKARGVGRRVTVRRRERAPHETDERCHSMTRPRLMARGSCATIQPLAVAPDELVGAERRDDFVVSLGETSAHREVVLEPFAGLHDDRYILSFPVASERDAGRRRAELAAEDARSDALEGRTLDAISFGQQQPESDHGLTLVDSESGYDEGTHWRRFRGEGAFTLQDWGASAVELRIAWLRDTAPRRLTVSLDDEVLVDRLVDPQDEPLLDLDLGAYADGRVQWQLAVGGGEETTPQLTEVRLMSARLG